MPKLSIITINYNNRDGLYRTLESIRLQTSHDFEYIVIDGGSTDGSVDLIKEYTDYIDYWISEPDKGIYNAMNKGVAMAHGDYCQFLNSGDWLFDTHSVENVCSQIDERYNLLVGYCVSADKSGSRDYNTIPHESEISLYHVLFDSLPHPSSIIKRTLLLENPYDETLSIVSDWKFFVELFATKKASYKRIDFPIACFDTLGISTTQADRNWKERSKIVYTYIHPVLFNDLCVFPIDTIKLFIKIKHAHGFREKLLKFIEVIINLYSIFKPKSVLCNHKENIYKRRQRLNKNLIIDFDISNQKS